MSVNPGWDGSAVSSLESSGEIQTFINALSEKEYVNVVQFLAPLSINAIFGDSSNAPTSVTFHSG